MWLENLSVIQDDRVHPSPVGHELMAQIFLKSQGFDVEIDECYETLKKLSETPYDEWEERRFELEVNALRNYFLYWCMYGSIKSDEFLMEMIKNYPDEKKDDFMEMCIDTYVKSGSDMKKDMQHLVTHTKTIYEKM